MPTNNTEYYQLINNCLVSNLDSAYSPFSNETLSKDELQAIEYNTREEC